MQRQSVFTKHLTNIDTVTKRSAVIHLLILL